MRLSLLSTLRRWAFGETASVWNALDMESEDSMKTAVAHTRAEERMGEGGGGGGGNEPVPLRNVRCAEPPEDS